MRRRRTPGRRRQAWRIFRELRRHALDGGPVKEEGADDGGFEPWILRSKLVRSTNWATASFIVDCKLWKFVSSYVGGRPSTPKYCRRMVRTAWSKSLALLPLLPGNEPGIGRLARPLSSRLRRHACTVINSCRSRSAMALSSSSSPESPLIAACLGSTVRCWGVYSCDRRRAQHTETQE